MKRLRHRQQLAIAAALIISLWLMNTSFLAQPLNPKPTVVAHRGLAQDFDRRGLTSDTCTASRMRPTPHRYLENTLPSIAAAFAYGADFVELDIHPTTDGHFAVFHDWTVDCRTDGTGVTREHTLSRLQSLDIGYGYTADGGKTYPFRGQGIGLMPSLEDVLEVFPHRNLIINIKSNDRREGVLLADRLAALPPERQGHIMVYGGEQPVSVIQERLSRVRTLWGRRLKQCLMRYAAVGWTGYVPAACQQTMLMIPVNYAPWFWGWPNRLLQRLNKVGTVVFLTGDRRADFSQGLDDLDALKRLPPDYSGGIWTDRIDSVGPAVKQNPSGE
jgi:glycerophosphoryl diester phosphodiesterase